MFHVLGFCFGWFLPVVVAVASLVASGIDILLMEGALAAPHLAYKKFDEPLYF